MLLVREETVQGDPLVDRLAKFFESVQRVRSDLEREGGAPISYPKNGRRVLRVNEGAVGAMEQIVTARMILLGSVYHHRKVRAADVMLSRILAECVAAAREAGRLDKDIMETFLDLDDWSLVNFVTGFSEVRPKLGDWLDRLQGRVLPRCVLEVKGSEHAESSLADCLRRLATDKSFVESVERELSAAVGKEVWIDTAALGLPQDPFEMLYSSSGIKRPMPFAEWLRTYQTTRQPIRIFVFSESFDKARKVLPSVLGRTGLLESPVLVERFLVSR